MPIKPENKKRYPENWKEIRERILIHAKNRCEKCGIKNYSKYFNKDGKLCKVVLTIAHLDHIPENCNDDNLKALCQKCHLTYDARHHADTAYMTKLSKTGQRLLFEV
jgi:hypothetical protein